MPTKSRRTPHKKQSKKAKSPNKGDRAKAAKLRQKLEKARTRKHARVEKDYRRKLRALEATGLYKPKKKIKRLTAARKKEINRRYSKFEDFLSKDAYIFVPIPTRSEKKRKAAIALAKKNKLATSPKGIFVPKTKHTVSAKAVLNKKKGTYRIKVKKVRKGKTGKKTVTEILPIEPLVSIEDELARIEDDAAALELKRGESLAYRVTLNEEGGYSWNVFQNPSQLKSYLSQGVSSARTGTPANRLQVYRSVTVMKVKHAAYFKEHPRPKQNPYYTGRTDKTGRSIAKIARNARSGWMSPWEQGYAAYNSGFAMNDNPYPHPPERRQWQNGYLQAKKDDGK